MVRIRTDCIPDRSTTGQRAYMTSTSIPSSVVFSMYLYKTSYILQEPKWKSYILQGSKFVIYMSQLKMYPISEQNLSTQIKGKSKGNQLNPPKFRLRRAKGRQDSSCEPFNVKNY